MRALRRVVSGWVASSASAQGCVGADGQEPTPGSPSRGFGSGMSLATGAMTSAPVAIGGPCGAGMRARARRL